MVHTCTRVVQVNWLFVALLAGFGLLMAMVCYGEVCVAGSCETLVGEAWCLIIFSQNSFSWRLQLVLALTLLLIFSWRPRWKSWAMKSANIKVGYEPTAAEKRLQNWDDDPISFSHELEQLTNQWIAEPSPNNHKTQGKWPRCKLLVYIPLAFFKFMWSEGAMNIDEACSFCLEQFALLTSLVTRLPLSCNVCPWRHHGDEKLEAGGISFCGPLAFCWPQLVGPV